MRRRLLFGLALAACLAFPLRGQNFVCSLSDKQEHDAPKAFDKLASLFAHPRCFNCHGGVVPFNNGKRGPHPEIASDGVVPGADGGEDFAATFKECGDCHDAFPSANSAVKTWRLAPFAPDMQFNVHGTPQPKSTLALCKQMKTRVRVPGAAGFIGHMKDDNGDVESPFLKVAFAGTLGWDPKDPNNRSNMDLAKEAFGSYPAPLPPVTQEQALQQAKDWVSAMGGKFRQPEDCGCIEKHYALRVLAHGVLNMPGFTWNVRFAGIGTSFPEIPLKFQDDGSFSGEVMAIPETDNQGSVAILSCSGERPSQIKVVLNGSWADITPSSYEPTNDPPAPPQHPINFKITFSQIATHATETCSTPIGTVMGGSNKTGLAQFTFEFHFPDPLVNQAVAVDWPAPFPGWSGAVRAQIIEDNQSRIP